MPTHPTICGYHGIDEATEREHIRTSVETIRRRPERGRSAGYIGTPGANTRRLVVEEGGFLYDSDAYHDELSYWTYDYGQPHLIIPHTLDDNDTRLARGLGSGRGFFVEPGGGRSEAMRFGTIAPCRRQR